MPPRPLPSPQISARSSPSQPFSIAMLPDHPFENYVMPFSIPLFLSIYALSYSLLFPSWKGKARYEAASCSMSLIHGSLTSILAAYDLFLSPWQLDRPNTSLENAVMSFSISYFLVDLMHYLLFVPGDLKFIMHHLATSIYMLSCKNYSRHGAISVMALMGLGEATSPLQSIWSICRMGRNVSPLAKKIYESTSLPFTILFTLTRGILGPWLTWKLCEFYLSNKAEHVIPFWLAASWMVMVVIGMVGSMMWMRSLWVGLRKFNAQPKKKPQ